MFNSRLTTMEYRAVARSMDRHRRHFSIRPFNACLSGTLCRSFRLLFVGTPANELISDLDIWFDRKDRMNYIYSTGKLGCLIGEDNLFQMAY